MDGIFFMKDIVDQYGPVVAVTGDMSNVVAWDGSDAFFLFETRTFDGEYIFVLEWGTDEINASSDASEIVAYAFEWLELNFG